MITCEKEPLKGYLVKKITGVHLLFFYSMGCMILYDMIFVVYFDQQTGLLVKINFLMLNNFFGHQRNKVEKKERKATQKHAIKDGSTSKNVLLFCWLTPKSWSTPEGNVIFS